MKREPYTSEDIQKMRQLQKQGKSWQEIAKEFGRTPNAIKAKLLYGKPQHIEARLPKKETPHRPMIALVGNPEEVTKTIRELFS